mgnify:CR=1 FL=1
MTISKYKYNWVLVDELAISKAPVTEEALKLLKKDNIQCILSLCGDDEREIPSLYLKGFKRIIVELPDHRQNKLPRLEDLKLALNSLEELIKVGPTLIHCVEAIERSPMVSILWIMKTKKLDFYTSLNYMMGVHKATNPTSQQLEFLLKNYPNLF